MASVFDEREEYRKSPYFIKSEVGDFTPFYITITICAVLGVSLFVLNIVLGCCSRYSSYWNDRHTGNRWLVSIWTATPHRQPALDYTELQVIEVSAPPVPQQTYLPEKVEYSELQKRESDI